MRSPNLKTTRPTNNQGRWCKLPTLNFRLPNKPQYFGSPGAKRLKTTIRSYSPRLPCKPPTKRLKTSKWFSLYPKVNTLASIPIQQRRIVIAKRWFPKQSPTMQLCNDPNCPSANNFGPQKNQQQYCFCY